MSPQPRADAPDREHSRAARRAAHDADRHRRAWINGVSLAVLPVLLLLGWLYIEQERRVARDAAAAQERAESDLRTELLALRLDDAGDAQQAVTRLLARRTEWEQWATASQFADLLAKANATATAAATATTRRDTIAALEQRLATPSQTPAAWLSMHEAAQDLVAAVEHAPDAERQHVLGLLDRVDTSYLAALRDAAAACGEDRTTACSHLIAGQALAAGRLDAAGRDREVRTHWEQQLRALAHQEDNLVASTWDTARIAATPWLDLLPGTSSREWVHSSSPGMQAQAEGDTLTLDMPVGDGRGGIVVLRGHEWRHCEVEFDLTLLRGETTVMLRAGKRASPALSAAVKFTRGECKNAVRLPGDRPEHVDLLLLGERLVVRACGVTREVTVPVRARSGGFALLVAPDTAARLGHLRVKALS